MWPEKSLKSINLVKLLLYNKEMFAKMGLVWKMLQMQCFWICHILGMQSHMPKKAIKKAQGGRICSFSPCLEQVQKACAKLDEEGFIEISTMECLLREFQVRKITIPLYDHNKESSEYVPNTPAATIEDSNNKRKLEETSETNGDTKKPNLETSFVTGIPLTTMPGHTGYLTFATLKPDLSQSIN